GGETRDHRNQRQHRDEPEGWLLADDPDAAGVLSRLGGPYDERASHAVDRADGEQEDVDEVEPVSQREAKRDQSPDDKGGEYAEADREDGVVGHERPAYASPKRFPGGRLFAFAERLRCDLEPAPL